MAEPALKTAILPVKRSKAEGGKEGSEPRLWRGRQLRKEVNKVVREDGWAALVVHLWVQMDHVCVQELHVCVQMVHVCVQMVHVCVQMVQESVQMVEETALMPQQRASMVHVSASMPDVGARKRGAAVKWSRYARFRLGRAPTERLVAPIVTGRLQTSCSYGAVWDHAVERTPVPGHIRMQPV